MKNIGFWFFILYTFQSFGQGGDTCVEAKANSFMLPWRLNDETVCKVTDDFDKSEFGTKASCDSYTIDEGIIADVDIGEWLYHFSPSTNGTIIIEISDFKSAGRPGNISNTFRNGSFTIIQNCPGTIEARCLGGFGFDDDLIDTYKRTFAIEAGTDYYIMVENRSLPVAMECIQFDLSVDFIPEPFDSSFTTFPCDNSDFSNGDLSGWSQQYGYTGTANEGDLLPLFSPIANGSNPDFTGQIHTGGYDPIIGGTYLARVKPGSDYSYQLGGENYGSKGERISQTFEVTDQKKIYSYSYALVQVTNQLFSTHDASFFSMRVKNKEGSIIFCGDNLMVAELTPNDNEFGFRFDPPEGYIRKPDFPRGTGGPFYTEWKTIDIDLRDYIGEEVTVEFTAAGAAWPTSYGYAYLTAQCKFESSNALCAESCLGMVEVGADITIYQGESLQLQPTTSGGIPVSYSWSPSEGVSDVNILNPIMTPMQTTTYTLTVDFGERCIITDSVTIVVNDPLCTLVVDDNIVTITDTNCNTNNGSITGIDVSGSSGNEDYEWSDQNGATAGTSVTLEDIGPGSYTLTITDRDCSAITGPYTINEIDNCQEPEPMTIRIANAMTPNNDGSNDMFMIEGLENYPNNKLYIFNRWGNSVYEASNYQNDWFGNYQNKPLPIATYYYILELNDPNRQVFKGTITIMR